MERHSTAQSRGLRRAARAPVAILAAALLLSPAAIARADTPATASEPQFYPGPFSDVSPAFWAAGAINDLAQANLAQAPGPHTFDPYGDQSRGAWIEQVSIALDVNAPAPASTAPYPDVPALTPLAAAVAQAKADGWLPFADASGLAPDAPITRQEAFAVLGLALFGPSVASPVPAADLPFTDAAAVAPWATGPLNALAAAGYVLGTGDGQVQPTDALHRSDAAALLDAVLGRLLTTGGQRYRIVAVRTLSATAYGNGEGVGGTTATGTPCHVGEAAAVPSDLPYGTLLWVTGYNAGGYLPAGGVLEDIEDTGGGLRPGDIDLYMAADGPTPYIDFGRQSVTADILAPLP